jgi:hypothetical protein
MRTLASAAALVALASVAGAAQAPLAPEAVAARTHQAFLALDRYLETWNTRDPARWATSLHFPHVRASAAEFPLFKTREDYIASVDFEQTLATGWRYTRWDHPRRVLQVGLDKVHMAGLWRRYAEDGRTLNQNYVTYVITETDGRWRIQARFGAGRPLTDAAAASRNADAARKGLDAFMTAWNSHDPDAFAAAIHYPHVRIADGELHYWATAKDFLAGTEPGRQRTWGDTRIDEATVEQVADRGANIAITYSRRSPDGQVMSRHQAVCLVTERAGAWKVQACSSMGT